MNNNSGILLLGANGFIGKRLVQKLRENFPDAILTCWSGEHDIRNNSIIDEIVSLNPEIIIVASGRSFVPDSWSSPGDFYITNTTGAIHIAEAARISKARIIFLSTFVYGEPYVLPIKETNSIQPFNPYASSKYLAEQVFKDYSGFFGIEINVLRLFNVYGKGQREDFLVPMLINQYQTGDQILVRDLNPKRDYVHVDDVLSAILASLKHFNKFQIYNVAGGKSYSVKEVIDVIFNIGGKSKPVINEKQSRPNEVADTLADISKIKNELGWEPTVSLKKGISEMLN